MLRRRNLHSNTFEFFMPAIQWRPREQPPQTPELANEAINNKPLSNAQRLSDIDFPDEEIPVEFIDYIFEHEIMDDPVKLDNQHIMDFENLKKWWAKSERDAINPVTNIPYTSLTEMPELKQKIEDFVNNQEVRSEKFKKEFEEKLKTYQLKREQAERERLKKLESHTTSRNEISQKIERSLSELDEKTLAILLAQLERIDKKIKKLHLGQAYYSDPNHIRQRIHAILIKHEREGVTEKSEKKLKDLLDQLEKHHRTRPGFISRIPHNLLLFYRSEQVNGFGVIANSSSIASSNPQQRFDL